MNPIRIIRRLAVLLAGLAATVVASIITASAAFATMPPPGSTAARLEQAPAAGSGPRARRPGRRHARLADRPDRSRRRGRGRRHRSAHRPGMDSTPARDRKRHLTQAP